MTAEQRDQPGPIGQPEQHGQPDQLERLVGVVRRLRRDCAWNAEQTHESLVRYLIEESFELVDAIETGDADALLEELGDVLYQVLFHAEIASADGEGFDIQGVAERAADKMVARHPHVFGDVVASTPEEIVQVWNAVKAREKSARTSVLDGVPLGMPSLALADKLIGKAHQVGVVELGVVGELPTASEDELGAALLGLVVAARDSGLDAERALRTTLRTLQAEIRAAEH